METGNANEHKRPFAALVAMRFGYVEFISVIMCTKPLNKPNLTRSNITLTDFLAYLC